MAGSECSIKLAYLLCIPDTLHYAYPSVSAAGAGIHLCSGGLRVGIPSAAIAANIDYTGHEGRGHDDVLIASDIEILTLPCPP